MEQFYVYGLVDPRNETIFYIGKGKGKRAFQHLSEKPDIHSNTEKLQIIEELRESGLEVRLILIGEQLSEEAALLLERLLIYRIGRKIFDEGTLTNIVPGGRWHKEASLFLKKENLPSLDEIEEQYPELIPILKNYPHASVVFTGLRCPKNPEDELLYVYNETGEKIHEWDIDYFIQIFGLGHSLDLINVLKNTSRPVYAWNRIWSKTNFEKLESVLEIPFSDYDEINEDFVREVNKSRLTCNNALLKCYYPDGQLQTEISHADNEISLIYFYANGFKKHQTNYLNRKLNGKCQLWHTNGQLNEYTDYNENVRRSKRSYFPSGNIKMIENYHDDGKGKSVKLWYDNGQVEFENNEDGKSFSYSKTGLITSKSIREGFLNEGGNLITWDYSEDGQIQKETKKYYVNGLLHGYERSFYETGEIKREVDYTNGHNNKVIKTFKKNGDMTLK
jgi:antitoxin component YwqK of YwqJK toxin-antitoxin module